ncbi:uncharacterized protein DUF1203 [Litoreibacter meonggei]|uniref:Uncharacterized protein DUF1203 n=1 Tax=Litoreibacter meonggei TaxID=1049199 RepID=A0A497VMW7_9RHOB|nr:DUF1203 domain-containing protein [Litoreibacter meonggei]RLJ41545.1 uncharacterized protein DUF1203 [Litoreibacter meonggei]
MRYTPYEQAFVDAVRAGGPDANGQPAEHAISDGHGKPCRCCLAQVPDGAAMLVLAARPFPEPQPYAELGPIFLCAKACAPYEDAGAPPILKSSPDYLLKAYSSDNRIIYGTGQITTCTQLESYAATLFDRADVAYIDVRSSRNNCFLTRIYRDD